MISNRKLRRLLRDVAEIKTATVPNEEVVQAKRDMDDEIQMIMSVRPRDPTCLTS